MLLIYDCDQCVYINFDGHVFSTFDLKIQKGCCM